MSWLDRLFHLHKWSKWEVTKEFRYMDHYMWESSLPDEHSIAKFGRPVLDQRRSCEECGEIELRRVFG